MWTLPIWIVGAHFVADWLFQTDWMALNKSKRWSVLSAHVSVYTLTMVVLLFGWVPFADEGGMRRTFVFAVITWVTHFLTDACTSRATSRLWFMKREDGVWEQAKYAFPKHGRTIINPWSPIDGKRHGFFVMIGFDQLIHYVTLALTWNWLR